jgi:hypothetical protein
LDEKSGVAGAAIPRNAGRHHQQAMALLDELGGAAAAELRSRAPSSGKAAAEALPGGLPVMMSDHPRVTSPVRIEASYREPRFSRTRRSLPSSSGGVILRALVKASGYLIVTEVLSSESRSHGPDDHVLASSAREAATFWRYEPARFEGRPVDARAFVVVRDPDSEQGWSVTPDPLPGPEVPER